MTLPALKEALDRIAEPSNCSGTYRLVERLALALPDGDVGAADDPKFIDWLLAHAEPAPFGSAKETKLDRSVRDAQRLVARGEVAVAGFDPAAVMDEIEAALSPRTHLQATLADVIVYPAGGKFLRHKDTPRSTELVGTLVVEVPSVHAGGAFVLDDGRGEQVFDWSGRPDRGAVRWVAFFSDVDHEVKLVTDGTRVTLVYSLARTARPRTDAAWSARHDQLRGALRQLADQTQWPVMIACARHVVAEDGGPPPTIAVLRGGDRDLADALREAGYDVGVRACLAAAEDVEVEGRFPQIPWSVARLKRPIATSVFDGMMTFAEAPEDDEGTDLSDISLAPHVLDEIEIGQWVIRETALATVVHESVFFSDSGYFGNEAYEANIYSLAALEIMPRA